MESALPDSFHPLIRAWFDERYGAATPVQKEAWPRIAAGDHVLAGAPTGSGKTLTAFLDALSRFAGGHVPVRGVSLLYVSPLKALNEDIRQNLIEPLRELSAYFAAHGESFPRVRVATRSGDTPQAERRRMLSDPPSILCTTPESLFILLSSKSGLALLSGLRLVIVDEIHALLGSKRGTSLASSLGRLSLLSGEFQRIGLSATLKSFEPAARFLAGRRLIREAGGAARYEARAVAVLAPPAVKRYELEVLWPSAPIALRSVPPEGEHDAAPSRYAAIVRDLARRMGGERGVLAFADSRRRAERLAAMLNEEAGEGSAWAHHGSLSKDVRRAVELRLKEGRLPCVVATSSLELGIDIGSIGLVALAGAPSRADQALQRLGRSGHGVGQSSRGLLYPFHGMDALQAAAISGAVFDKEVDELSPPESPLDMLAQIILSMLLFEPRGPQKLYEELLSFSPYTSLTRHDFDAVIAMLAGRYADSRVKELSARIYLDEDDGLLHAREGAAMLLYGAGGSIPDRGYYALRLAGSGAKLGELDEEFVFERRVGNSFSLGAQAWRITNISDEAVEVTPLGRGADFMPFWKAEKASRGRSVARRMLELCQLVQSDPSAFGVRLRKELAFGDEAASALEGFLTAQKRAQKDARLPSPSSLTLELHRDPDKRQDAVVAFIHTLRGLSVNEPLGIALSARIADELGLGIERLANDDSIYLLLPLSDLGEARSLVERSLTGLGNGTALMDGLRSGLEASGAFGAAFRENAGRALLLPRSGFKKRSPLWITRLRAKRLFERVRGFEDFPIVKESWKSMLYERFDLERLGELCRGLGDGSVGIEAFTSVVPSPFAEGSGWAETNRYLYEGDELRAGQSGFAAASRTGGPSSAGSPVSAGDRAIEAALGDARLRPLVPKLLYDRFMRRFLREEPGWAPESVPALLDWVDERVFIPRDEWDALLRACPQELADAAVLLVAEGKKLVRVSLEGSSMELISPQSRAAGLKADPGAFLADWLRSSGPVSLARLHALFGLAADELRSLAQALHEGGSALYDEAGIAVEARTAEPTLCDRDALEALLRSVRKASRPDMLPRPPGSLASFLAAMQGLGSDQPVPRLSDALHALSGYPLPVELWERDILPARIPHYKAAELDALLASGAFLWFGAKAGSGSSVAFCPADEWELFGAGKESALIQPGSMPLDFWAIKLGWDGDMAGLVHALWAEADKGAISADSFDPWRTRAQVRPVPEPSASGAMRRGRVPAALRGRWKAGPPLTGRWFSLELDDLDSDEADELDMASARVRVLARRYGVLSRALLEHELPSCRWQALFPALRRLELAGELVAGRFFEELEGVQFLSQEAFARFSSGASATGIWSISAQDPASPAGLYAPGRQPPGYEGLPARSRRNHVAFRGGELAWTAQASFRELRVFVSPDDPELSALLSAITRFRQGGGSSSLIIRTINELRAVDSPYAGALERLGFERDRGSLRLW